MSGRDVTDEELDALIGLVDTKYFTRESCRRELRRFAREMQARGVEHAAACTDRGPREYLLREAARIREGQS